MDVVQSPANAVYKACLKLAQQRRERLKTRQTLLDGIHLLQSAVAANWSLLRVLVEEGRAQDAEIQAVMAGFSGPVTCLSRSLFSTLTELPSSSGILAIVGIPQPPELARHGAILALDGVQDPGNVGTILRTAAAAGVAQVWLGEGCADAWSPRVLRAGMGAHFVVPVLERVDLQSALAAHAGDILVTTLAYSQPFYHYRFPSDFVLVLGSEGGGISAAILAAADQRLRLPMAPGVESLNVAAASAICLYEWVRQRGAD
jgi:TrmH family RNA methyltransferase